MNSKRDLNLRRIPNTEIHYVNKDGEVLRLSGAYFDTCNSSGRFTFSENGKRFRFTRKKAKELYNKLENGFQNVFVLRDCLGNMDLSDKEINKFLYRASKKFRQNELWNIQNEIIYNKMKLIVCTDLTFQEFYDRINVLIKGGK